MKVSAALILLATLTATSAYVVGGLPPAHAIARRASWPPLASSDFQDPTMRPDPEKPPPLETAETSEPPAVAEAGRWYVTVPTTFDATADQAARAVMGAVKAGKRQVLVEAATPELDPASGAFRVPDLVRFAHSVAMPMAGMGLPAGRPHVKLLFANAADATIAGAAIMSTDTPVSCLGHPSALGPRDGAFVVVAPSTAERSVACEAALADLLVAAAGRPVVLVNPRLGNSPLTDGFEPAYLLKPLSLGYMKDQFAEQVTRVGACLLRCYPHEWTALFDAGGGGTAAEREWSYAGRFAAPPRPEALEELLRASVQRARDAEFARAAEAGPGA